jgi:predicted nucleic acid-binding protein
LKLAFDTNVVLDVLLDRAPFAEAARQLWAAVEAGRIEGVLPAHAFPTLWYLVAEARTAAAARGVVALVARVFGVAAIDEAVVRRALELEFRDFEDAVCAASAEAAACDLVVTRNQKDFASSPVTAVDPITALALIEGGGSTGVSERRTGYRTRRRKRRRALGPRGGAGARRAAQP